MKNQLLNKIHTHTAQIAIIGLGYVGLPLAVAFAEAGFPVVGMDVDGGKGAARHGGRPQRRPLHHQRHPQRPFGTGMY